MALTLLSTTCVPKVVQPIPPSKDVFLAQEFMTGPKVLYRFKPPKKLPFIRFFVPRDSPVKSIVKGKVVAATYSKGYGNNVLIRSYDSVYTRYFHLSFCNVAVGDKVKAGTIIGKTGTSGLIAAPALGLRMTIDSTDVDPCLFIDCDSYAKPGAK